MEFEHLNDVLQIEDTMTTSGTVFHFDSSVTTPCLSTLPTGWEENQDKFQESSRASCMYSHVLFPFDHVRGTSVGMQETYRKLSSVSDKDTIVLSYSIFLYVSTSAYQS